MVDGLIVLEFVVLVVVVLVVVVLVVVVLVVVFVFDFVTLLVVVCRCCPF